MTTDSKVCSCGHCSDAAERVAQFICKSIDDDECALFAFAMCAAMTEIGQVIEYSTQQQALEGDGLIGALSVSVKAHEVVQQMQNMIKAGPYIDLINDALARYYERKREETNLPKDT